jgi:hypothetical protein
MEIIGRETLIMGFRNILFNLFCIFLCVHKNDIVIKCSVFPSVAVSPITLAQGWLKKKNEEIKAS